MAAYYHSFKKPLILETSVIIYNTVFLVFFPNSCHIQVFFLLKDHIVLNILMRLSLGVARTTILLWIIWSVAAFAYYGIVLMSAELFETQGQLCSLDGKVGQ